MLEAAVSTAPGVPHLTAGARLRSGRRAQARGEHRSATIVRCAKATMRAYLLAIPAYPAEALVALCESVQADDELDARCRLRAPGACRVFAREQRR